MLRLLFVLMMALGIFGEAVAEEPSTEPAEQPAEDASEASPEEDSTDEGATATADSEEEKSSFEKLDEAFGKYVVDPFAMVLFYDLMFWDNTLPLGDGVGEVFSIQKVFFQDLDLVQNHSATFEEINLDLVDHLP